jgi:hypothetical protein
MKRIGNSGDTWELPESDLSGFPNIHQKYCTNIWEMIRSRAMQLIATQTLKKINPKKRSLYKKMLERKLNVEEAISLIKIVGRFLRWDTKVSYQFPENEEESIDYGLLFLEKLWDKECIIPCLEIFLQILEQWDQSEIYENIMSRYGVYPLYQWQKIILIYTSDEGKQQVYLWNGLFKSVVDYGEGINILEIDTRLVRRDTGEKIGYIKTPNYEYHVLHTVNMWQYLVYWDIVLQKWIVYFFNYETKEFERFKDDIWKSYFVVQWSQYGFSAEWKHGMIHIQ